MAAADPLGLRRGGERVECRADRPVADRVEVQLEAEVGEPADRLCQLVGLDGMLSVRRATVAFAA